MYSICTTSPVVSLVHRKSSQKTWWLPAECWHTAASQPTSGLQDLLDLLLRTSIDCFKYVLMHRTKYRSRNMQYLCLLYASKMSNFSAFTEDNKILLKRSLLLTLSENLWRVADKLVENWKNMFIYLPIGLTCFHMFQYMLTYWDHIVFNDSLWMDTKYYKVCTPRIHAKRKT